MLAGDAEQVSDPTIVAEIAALWAQSGWPAQPDDAGTGITAPFNAPALGPPPWFVYEVEPRTAILRSAPPRSRRVPRAGGSEVRPAGWRDGVLPSP